MKSLPQKAFDHWVFQGCLALNIVESADHTVLTDLRESRIKISRNIHQESTLKNIYIFMEKEKLQLRTDLNMKTKAVINK